VFPITVPPLRQRPEDIPLLVSQFVEKHCRTGQAGAPVSKATMKVLQARDWPGNVRELENVVERAVISSRGSMLDLGDALPRRGPPRAGAPGPRTLVQLEHDHIVATLERLRWKIEGDEGAARSSASTEHAPHPHAQARHQAPASLNGGVARLRKHWPRAWPDGGIIGPMELPAHKTKIVATIGPASIRPRCSSA